MVERLTPEDRAVIHSGLAPAALRHTMACQLLQALALLGAQEGAEPSPFTAPAGVSPSHLLTLSGGWSGPVAVAWQGETAPPALVENDAAVAAAVTAALPALTDLVGSEVTLASDPPVLDDVSGWTGAALTLPDGLLAVLFPPPHAPGADDWQAVTAALSAAAGVSALFAGERQGAAVAPDSRCYPLSRKDPDSDAALILDPDTVQSAAAQSAGGVRALAERVAAAVGEAAGEPVRALAERRIEEGLLPGAPTADWLTAEWELPGMGRIALALPASRRSAWVAWAQPADGAQAPISQMSGSAAAPREPDPPGWEIVRRIPVIMRVMLGGTRKSVDEVLRMQIGDLIELDRFYDEPHEIYVGNVLIGTGETRVVEEREGTHYGVLVRTLDAGEAG